MYVVLQIVKLQESWRWDNPDSLDCVFLSCGFFFLAIIAKVTNMAYGEGIAGITAEQFYDVEVSHVYKGVGIFSILYILFVSLYCWVLYTLHVVI